MNLKKVVATDDLYENRAMISAYPEMSKLAHEAFQSTFSVRVEEEQRIKEIMNYLTRLVDKKDINKVAVLGCGPNPEPSKILIDEGYDVISIEPVESFVDSASVYLGGNGVVLHGAAESIPLSDNSQQLVFFESVLEHVDSIRLSLQEIYRVLAPGGILYMNTTNRHQFSLKGFNGEYHVPFYNWLPKLIKECYVHDHLHHRPYLANFSSRPAVHWFSFSSLCDHGRDAGFARFYAITDLLRPTDDYVLRSKFRKKVLRSVQRNPWVRALAISQMSGRVIMWKRAD